MKINLHVVMNNFNPDRRVLRAVLAIEEIGYFDEVHIAAIGSAEKKDYESFGDSISVFRLLQPKRKNMKKFSQFIHYRKWINEIVKKYTIRNDIDVLIVHCHDLATLPVGSLLKNKLGAKVIYDAHELESEREGLKGIKKIYKKMIEISSIRKADFLITVSELIRKWYQKKYKLEKTCVIRNIQETKTNISKESEIKQKFKINEKELTFVFCGNLNKSRDIDHLINLFILLGEKYHLIIFGNGPLENFVREKCKQYHNLHYGGFVHVLELTTLMSGADIGILISKGNKYLNQVYSLPNKFFQYIDAELPILVTDFEEIKSYIEKYNIGWSVNGDIINYIKNISLDSVENVKVSVRKVKKVLTWENEAKKLHKIYNEIIKE